MLNQLIVDDIIKRALQEDMPFGDITTDNLINEESISKAVMIAKENGVIAGLDVAARVFEILDEKAVFKKHVSDGCKVSKGDIIAEIEGKTRALLKGERTALNILQRLSGIASKTNEICEIVKDLPVSIADTRKTMPGLRILDKYAVKMGGGSNHRYSLSDGVLIKDNHIAGAGSITKAVKKVKEYKKKNNLNCLIEVETKNFEEINEALQCGIDIIMLDNFSVNDTKKAVNIINNKCKIEASGGININTLVEVAETGVDYISVGALTHSVRALDLSLLIDYAK